MTDLDNLYVSLASAKEMENQTKALRIRIEQEICKLVKDRLKTEGSVTIKGSEYKCVITTGFNRNWNQGLLSKIKPSFPQALWPFVETEIESRAGTRFIENSEPMLWSKLRSALTLTDKKPGLVLSELSNKEKG